MTNLHFGITNCPLLLIHVFHLLVPTRSPTILVDLDGCNSNTFCLPDGILLGVMSVSRPSKRIDLCIEALLFCQRFKLIIAGDALRCNHFF